MFVDGGRERGRGCWVPGGATDARGEDEGVDMREWDERGVDGGDGVELYGGRFGSGCVDRKKKRQRSAKQSSTQNANQGMIKYEMESEEISPRALEHHIKQLQREAHRETL